MTTFKQAYEEELMLIKANVGDCNCGSIRCVYYFHGRQRSVND